MYLLRYKRRPTLYSTNPHLRFFRIRWSFLRSVRSINTSTNPTKIWPHVTQIKRSKLNVCFTNFHHVRSWMIIKRYIENVMNSYVAYTQHLLYWRYLQCLRLRGANLESFETLVKMWRINGLVLNVSESHHCISFDTEMVPNRAKNINVID